MTQHFFSPSFIQIEAGSVQAMAAVSGAKYMRGREGRDVFGESFFTPIPAAG
jgi:hypothetical protein